MLSWYPVAVSPPVAASGPSALPTDDPPRAVSGQHLPALDGVRAVAILAVLAFHLGFGWAVGGFLGVDLFFVLSGFLITSLLIEEWCVSGRIAIGAFWGRRVRRLMPALVLVVTAIVIYVVVVGRLSSHTSPGVAMELVNLRGDAISALFFVGNWHMIVLKETLSPLSPIWSLAVEEQFYLVWPIAIVVLLKLSPKRWRPVGLVLCIAGALASVIDMGVLYQPGVNWLRAYYGTDTRAFALLVGAALAMVSAGRLQPGARIRSSLHVAGPVALVALFVFWVTARYTDGWMYRGGFGACAILAALVVADVRLIEPGPLAKLLSLRPLRWIGTISYGLYLWHWPVIYYLYQGRTGLPLAVLDIVRVALTFGLATASYYLVERPIRSRRLSVPIQIVAPCAALLTVLIVFVGTTPAVADPVRTWLGGGLDPGFGPTVPGAGGVSSGSSIALAPGQTISPSHPLRVLTIGDSVMAYAQVGITEALEGTGEVDVTSNALPVWGLSSPDADTFLVRSVQEFHPQVVIASWSADNATAKADPGAYQRTLATAIRTLLSPGDGVVGVIFLQMPAFGPIPGLASSSSLSQSAQLRADGVSNWNQAVNESARKFPGRVLYLPVAGSLEVGGRYTNWLPPSGGPSGARGHWVRVRTTDGVGLCPPGITRYSAAVRQDLTEIFHLDTSRTPWWNSDAIKVRAFDSTTCPDDHPPAP